MFGRKKNNQHVAMDEYIISEKMARFYSRHSRYESIIPGVYKAEPELTDFIQALLSYTSDLEYEKEELHKELEAIKPIINNPNYKPAISSSCMECKFAAYSSFDKKLIGCRKHMLCEDFKKEEE